MLPEGPRRRPSGSNRWLPSGPCGSKCAGDADVRLAVLCGEQRRADEAGGTFVFAFLGDFELDRVPAAGEAQAAVLRSAVGEHVILVVRSRILDRRQPAQLIVRRAVREPIGQSRAVGRRSWELGNAQQLDRVIGRRAGGQDHEGQRRQCDMFWQQASQRGRAGQLHDGAFFKKGADRKDDRHAGFASGGNWEEEIVRPTRKPRRSAGFSDNCRVERLPPPTEGQIPAPLS